MKPGALIPNARNFYRPDDYFSLNVQNGVLRSTTGVRMLTIPEEMILGLHRGLEDETGRAAGVILYSVGKWWGKQFLLKHSAEVRQLHGTEPSELPLAFFLQVLRRVWALYGWGKIDVSFAQQERGFLVVTVDGALYSEVVGNIGRTSDHVVAGVLSSVISGMAGQDLECVEIACKSHGSARCRFVVGAAKRISVLESWVAEGRTASSILDSLGKGQVP